MRDNLSRKIVYVHEGINKLQNMLGGKKMGKKIISLLLAFVLLTSATSAFALDGHVRADREVAASLST